MKKFKNIYKYKILLVGIATLSMIGAFFTPIVNSIPININNNNQNITEQNINNSNKDNSNNPNVLELDSEHQGIWVNVTKTVNPKNIHPCEPATIFINISAQGNPLPIHIPVAVMLVIDTSGSMSWQYKNETGVNHPALYYIKIAAINFINQMDLVNDTAGIVSFADHATLKKQLTHNKNDLINTINSLTANGATNTGEGIRIAQQELDLHSPNNAYPVIILMTDGLPTTHHQGYSWQSCENCPISNNTCTNYARSEANLSKAANTSVFSIAFTEGIYGYCQQNDTVDYANWLLLDISSGTDYFYTTADINTLEQIYQNISSKIGQIVINNLQVTDYLPNNIEVLSTGGGTYSVLPNGTKKMIFTKNFLSLNDTWHISFNISTNIIGNNILVNYPNSNLSYVITNTTTNTTYSEYLPYPNYINITNPLIIEKKAPNQVYPGRQFNYTINVTNIGHITLNDIIIIDPLPENVTFNSIISNYSGFSINNWKFYTSNNTLIINNITIQINEKIWFKITVTVKNNASGTLINTAHSGYCMDNNLVNSSFTTNILTSDPSININKSANNHLVQIGDTITYTFNVTNTGTTTLTNVNAVDNILGPITLGTTILNPGEFTTGTATYTVTENNLPGPIVNYVLATGIDPIGNQINNTDSEYVVIIYSPQISLDKQANVNTVNIGDTITYKYTITNTGDVTLTGVNVIDDMLGSITLGTTTLNPGGTTTGTATYIVTESDLPGPIINNATATGTPPYGDDVTDTANQIVTIEYEVDICLNKEANINTASVGQIITYTYSVTNCGDVTLTGVNVIDDMLGSITLGTTTLNPGGTTTGTATYIVTESDLPGPIINNATATGTPPYGDDVTDTASESVSLTFISCISIEKQANVASASVGQTITYTYSVTNCGDVTLTSVTIFDDILGSITLGTTTLNPGGTTTGTASYIVTEGDLPGPIVNTATVTGVDPLGITVSNSDSESVSLTYTACITINKEANVANAVIGQTITYTYTVTNCGDVTLTGIIVVDNKLGSITLGTTTLSPGGTTTGTKTYTVQESDLPGPIVNIATATGTPPVGSIVTDIDSESVSLTYTACIDIDKQANVATASIGQTITYTYTVTNCGQVTLTGITVVDNKLGSITLGTTTLSPGQSTQGTKSIIVECEHYPILTNIATTTGTDPTGSTVTDQDSESVNIIISASIDIKKMVWDELSGKWTTSLSTFVGYNINFQITVNNNGDNILNNVIVIDYLPSNLKYNYDGNPAPASASDHQIQWNIGVLNIGQTVTLYFSAKTITEGNSNNKANASGVYCKTVFDQSEIPINVLPCRNEVWIDDNWHGQSDVNLYNPSLTWGVDAFNRIQKGIDVLCPCGTVHVRSGSYIEQIIINKDLQMLGENKPLIVLPNIARSFTIHNSAQSWIPIILAYAGTLIGNDIQGSGHIAVKIDGFKLDAGNIPGSVDILYHDVESGCIPAIISNNLITRAYIGIKIDECSTDTTIIHNRITWEKRTSGRIGIIITSSQGCEPNNLEIHYNYIGAPCGLNIGIWNQVSIMADADYNWWGEDDGPGSPTNGYTYDAITGRIADGLGDDVIGPVHFDPWWGTDACANVHPLDVVVGNPVYFDASCSFAYDENGAINPTDIEYMWKFGDGVYSFSKICTHIYKNPGNYNVVLRVTVYGNYYIEGVSGNLIDFNYFKVHVYQTTAPLYSNADSKNLKGYEGLSNYPIQLYGSAEGGEPPYTYKWDLGDGSTLFENNPIHIYKEMKEYNAILTVTDSIGATAQDNASVTIYKDKLTAKAGGPYIGNAGEEILFKGEAAGGLEPYYYIWDFSYGRNIIQEQNPTYTFDKEGTYHVKLVVIDSKGNIDEDIIEVQIIENNQPVIKQVTGGFRITATIFAGDNDCNWTIKVNGNFILYGGDASGTIETKTEETVKLPITIAFGKVDIKVTANEIQKQYTAFALGPLFLKIQEK